MTKYSKQVINQMFSLDRQPDRHSIHLSFRNHKNALDFIKDVYAIKQSSSWYNSNLTITLETNLNKRWVDDLSVEDILEFYGYNVRIEIPSQDNQYKKALKRVVGQYADRLFHDGVWVVPFKPKKKTAKKKGSK